MEDMLIRFSTFVIVIAGLAAYFYWSSRQDRRWPPTVSVKKMRSQKRPEAEDFWLQVYDTDSAEEARKIQTRFHDLGIQCFLYEQGKKDVYGNVPKHYGISVPRKSSEKAQSVLAQITL